MANTLPHDQDGFLMGEGGRPLNQAATAMLSSLSGIRSATMSTARGVEALGRQMALLRQAMESRASQPPASKPRQAAPQNAATPAGTPTRRDATPRLPTPPSQPAGTQPARQDTSSAPTPPSQPAVAQRERSAAKAAQASNQARGKDGRFSGKSDSGQGKEAADAHSTAQAKDDPSAASPLTSAANRMTDAAKAMTQEAASGADQVDPTVQAMKEVAAPVARGWQAWGEFRGNGNKDKAQEGLLKRILARMGAMKKSTDKASTDASKASAQTNKHLENLENKPTGGGEGGGFFGGLLAAIAAIVPMILALLTKIPVIGPLLAMGGKLVSGVGGALAGAGAGVLKKIPVLGKMMGGGAAAGEAAGGAAAGAGTAAEKAAGASKLANFGKGILKKIPLIGGLLAGAGAASEIYDSETSDASRRDKDKTAGKAVGGLGGTIAGGMAGAKIGALAGTVFGPIGTAIGGVIGAGLGAFLGDQAGQIIGDKVGEWTNDLRNADIAGAITGAWDSVVSGFNSAYESIGKTWGGFVDSAKAGWDTIGKTWGGFVDSAKAGWDTIANLFKAAYEGLKSIPVIGPAIQAAENAAKKTAAVASAATETAKAKAVEVGTKAVEKGKEVAQATKEKAVEVGTKAAEVGGKAVDATTQAASKAGEAVKQGAEWAGKNTTLGRGAVAAHQGVKAAGEWVLGQTSKRFESGGGGAATVSSGKGDLGGASYGTYQLSSKKGKVQDFLKTSKYGEQFAGLQPGTPEFNAKWKEVAKADPEFATAQHDYIKRTNFDPAVAGLAKAGFNTSNMSPAMQDAIWSTSVHFGAGSEKRGNGAIGLFKKAFAGKDYNSMSDEERIKTLQDYKLANNEKLFASSSANHRAGTAKRAVAEKNALLALAGKSASSPTPDASANKSASSAAQKSEATSSQPVSPSSRMPSPVVATPTVSTPPAPSTPPKMASTATVPDAKVEPPAPVAVTASSGGASGMAAQGVSQHLSNPTIAHIVTGGIGFRG